MRRALWLSAFVLLVSGASCKSSGGDDTGGGGIALTEAGTGSDGGLGDESGTGTGGPVDKVAPQFAGVESVTAIDQSQIAVTWKPATDDVTQQGTIAYRVYIGGSAGGESFAAPILTAPAGATGATIPSLKAGTPYFIVVRAVDGAGNEDANTVEKTATTTDTEAPEFAGVKDVEALSATEAKVIWAAATDNGSDASAIKYEVYASATQGGENFTTPTLTTAPGATEATLSGLAEAKPVFVVVRAVDAFGNKDINKKEGVGVTLDKTPPTFAGVATAVASGTTIGLTWAAGTDNVDDAAALTYQVFGAETAAGQVFTTPLGKTLPGVTSFAATNLKVSTKYYFVVRASDSVGNVDANVIEKSATTAASPDVTPPTFAGLVTATPTTDQTIDLAWSAATDDFSPPSQLVYDIFLANVSGGESYASPSFTSAAGATSFTVTGLTPITDYYFVVRARDQAGNQNVNTIEKQAKTFPDTVPPTFAGLATAAATGPTSIQLNWPAATDDISPSNAIKYRVYRSTTPGGQTFGTPTVNVPAGQTSVDVTGLSQNTTYYFVVRAVDEAGTEDANSIEKNAKTDADVTPPTFAGANTFVSTAPTSLTVGWAPATDNVTPQNQIVYLVYLATSAGGENFLGAPTFTTAAGATSATLTSGLTQDTPYFVVVRARDAVGRVDANVTELTVSTQKDTTPPTFAGAQSVGSATDQSLRVTWLAATDNVTPQANLTYLVCRTTTNGGCTGNNFTTTATVPNGGLNFNFTGLVPSTQYFFVVRARDAYNNTTPAANDVQVSGSTIDDLVEPVFAGLTSAVSNSATTIDLAWAAATDDVTPAGQIIYDIYQASASGAENYASPTHSTAAGATTFKVTGLLPGQQRFFVVRARDQNGNDSNNTHVTPGQEKSATVIADSIAPTFAGVTAVNNLAAPAGFTGLQVLWNAATDNVTPQASILYDICWSTGAACTASFTPSATSVAGATSYNIAGLLLNTTYNVVVRARDQYNNRDTNVVSLAKKTLADTTAPVSGGPPQISGSTSTSLTVSWPAATDNFHAAAALNYLVCQGTTAAACQGAGFTATYSSAANELSHTFAGLVNGQTYYYVVRPRDPVNNIEANNTQISGVPANDTTPPTFVGVSGLTVQSSTAVLVQWAAGTDDVSTPGQLVYDIYRSTVPFVFPLSAPVIAAPQYTSGAGATSFSATGLTPDTTYYFHVRARDQAGLRSTNAVQLNAKTDKDVVKPTFAGVNAVNQTSSTSLQATWLLATDDTTPSNLITYQVCWSTIAPAAVGGCDDTFVALATTAANATSYTATGLIPNNVGAAHTYYFVVRAVDAYGNVDTNTNTIGQTTLNDTTKPVFAGATTVDSVTFSSARVNWAVATDDYTVAANMKYRLCITQVAGGCNAGAFVTAQTVTNVTNYTFSSLTPNTQYYWVVRAEDQAGNVNTTNENVQVTATTNQETTPPTFAGLTGVTVPAGSPGASGLQLAWNAGSDTYTPVTSLVYDIYTGASLPLSAPTYAAAPLVSVPGIAGANTYTVTGLSPGTQYCFVARARDLAGNRDTNTVGFCATTRPTLPGFTSQPTVGSVGQTTIPISWVASSTPVSAITYTVCISAANGGCDNFVGGTAAATTTTHNFAGLTANTTYYMRVKAVNSTGTTYSNQVSALTAPIPPTWNGAVTCQTYAGVQFPSYLYIGISAATPGSFAISGYDYCASTSALGCALNFVDEGDLTVGNRFIGSPAPWNPPEGKGIQSNGPALLPNTAYYVVGRVRDVNGNVDVSGATLCTTPISYTQDILPTFTGSCNYAGCHGNNGYGPWTHDYFAFTDNTAAACAAYPNYTVAGGSWGNSLLYRKVAGSQGICGAAMPNPTVGSFSFSTLLSRWLSQGRYEN